MPRSQTKSAAIKRLEGNRGRRPIPAEIIAPGKLPPPPTHLTASQKARWRDIARALPAGMLAAADEATVERAAVSWDAYRAVTDRINRGEPFTVSNAAGAPVLNPLFSLRQKLEKAMNASAYELDLSPLARTRMASASAAEVDPYELLCGPTGLAWTDFGQPQ